MNEKVKSFFIGLFSGVLAALSFVFGIFLHGKRNRTNNAREEQREIESGIERIDDGLNEIEGGVANIAEIAAENEQILSGIRARKQEN